MTRAGSFHIAKLLFLLFSLALVTVACNLKHTMGTLENSETFEIQGGHDYTWTAEVVPGKEYEVILTSADLEFTGSYLRLSVTNGEECEGCTSSVGGPATQDGLSVNFIAPDSGRARIWVYVREGNVECIIQIHEKV